VALNRPSSSSFLSAVFRWYGAKIPPFASFPIVFVLVLGFWSSGRKTAFELPSNAAWLLRVKETDDEDDDDSEI
jgi:hypothetical protein